jgi:hypothetical protein
MGEDMSVALTLSGNQEINLIPKYFEDYDV